jgi:7 transmembrane receptor (rhodopsin family)
MLPTVEGPLSTTSDDFLSAAVDDKAYDVDDVISPTICSFEVNAVYGVVSSCVSFWTPAAVIVFAYVKIFREAQRQQARIRSLTSSMSSSHGHCRFKHHLQQEQQQQQHYEHPVSIRYKSSRTI